jgi:hypothetical protein
MANGVPKAVRIRANATISIDLPLARTPTPD